MPVVVQLSLWDYLDTASKTPVDADLFGLLDRVSESIELLPTSEKLAVAGEAILRLGEIYGSRCAVTLAEIGYLSHPEREPCLPLDAFDVYVRQSSFVDLEQFIEAPELPEYEREYNLTIVREKSKAEILAEIGESEEIDPEVAYQQAMALAHDENVSEWGAAIAQYLEANGGSATLVDLSNNITLDLVKVWLGLLLGGLDISIEQTSDDFYSQEGILIV
jgi:hypothetical protein